MRAINRCWLIRLEIHGEFDSQSRLPRDSRSVALVDTKDLTPSRAAVTGSCECPYDVDSAGRFCGGRSTY